MDEMDLEHKIRRNLRSDLEDERAQIAKAVAKILDGQKAGFLAAEVAMREELASAKAERAEAKVERLAALKRIRALERRATRADETRALETQVATLQAEIEALKLDRDETQAKLEHSLVPKIASPQRSKKLKESANGQVRN